MNKATLLRPLCLKFHLQPLRKITDCRWNIWTVSAALWWIQVLNQLHRKAPSFYSSYGHFTHHVKQQYWCFCRTLGHRFTLMWMLLLVFFLNPRRYFHAYINLHWRKKGIWDGKRPHLTWCNWDVVFVFRQVCGYAPLPSKSTDIALHLR